MILLLRRAELEQTVAEERSRLRRVEAHLRAIEGSTVMEAHDIVVKKTQPLRVAQARGTAAASVVHRGGMENIGAVYESLIGWIEDSGFTLAGYSRELYHEIGDDGPSVTELQVPIAR